ncbi:hypothetical protein EMIT0194MI4_80255 [Pseudomonas sp. IT-194MI4]
MALNILLWSKRGRIYFLATARAKQINPSPFLCIVYTGVRFIPNNRTN